MGLKTPHWTAQVQSCGHLSMLTEPLRQWRWSFLKRIATGDYKHGSTTKSLEANASVWNGKTPNFHKKKLKSQLSAGKVILTVFWNSQGPVLQQYLEKGSTVNSGSYNEMLSNELKLAIRSKHRGLLSEGMLLLHDTCLLYTSYCVVSCCLPFSEHFDS